MPTLHFIEDDEWEDYPEDMQPEEWKILLALLVIFIIWLVLMLDKAGAI